MASVICTTTNRLLACLELTEDASISAACTSSCKLPHACTWTFERRSHEVNYSLPDRHARCAYACFNFTGFKPITIFMPSADRGLSKYSAATWYARRGCKLRVAKLFPQRVIKNKNNYKVNYNYKIYVYADLKLLDVVNKLSDTLSSLFYCI